MENKRKIQSFTDLEVWQESHKLALSIYKITKAFPNDELFGLTSQLRRNAVSISSNIAEGFSRESYKEKVQFFSIAHGSLTELITQLLITRDVGYIDKESFDSVNTQATSVHKLLNAFIKKTKTLSNLNSRFQIPDSKQKGFSLIELLISIAIIVTLGTVTVVGFRKGEQQKRVSLASDRVVLAIRNAQNLTLTAKEISQSSCANKAPKAYRISFSFSSNYSLYADDNCGGQFTVETFTLPQSIRIKSGGLLLNGNSINLLALRFLPPFATLTASNDGSSFNSFTNAQIILELTDGSVSKTVTVDGISGRIE